MKDNYTHLTMVIDRSGSMAIIQSDAEGGINTYIEDNKGFDGEATLLLVDFDAPNFGAAGNVLLNQSQFGTEEWYRKAFLGSIKDAPKYKLTPRGGTALYDAVHRAIVETGEYLRAMDEADRPSKVMFIIMTDGQENSSNNVTLATVNEAITRQTDEFKWEFVFLGAGFDVAVQAQNMGISVSNTTNFAPTGRGVAAAFAAHSGSTESYRSKGFANYAGKTDESGEVTMDEGRTEVTK